MARCIHRLLSESNKNQETVETVDNLTKQHLLGSLSPTFFVSFNYEKRAAALRNI
jgi:hypothetical protein